MRFRLRLFVADEYKPLHTVPLLMWVFTLGALVAQIVFSNYLLPPPEARQQDYTAPPREMFFQVGALGEQETLAKFLALQLQAFDNQPGISVPFAELNYEYLGQWLDRIVALDERAEYPHFLMAKIYAPVKDDERRYQAVHWVWKHFLKYPDERWWWMAHVTNFVKHILKDDALALEMARDLREKTTAGKIPNWPRQMEAFFLENQNEFDAAATILQNQLEAGKITDPQEFTFLIDRLEKIIIEMHSRGEFTSEQQFLEKINTLDKLQDNFLQQFDDTQK